MAIDQNTAEYMSAKTTAYAYELQCNKDVLEKINTAATQGKYSITLNRVDVHSEKFLKFLGYRLALLNYNEVTISW